MKTDSWLLRTSLFVFALHAAAGCMANADGSGANGSANSLGTNPDGTPVQPFTAQDTATYTNKVKNLLTGLAATPDELNQVASNPAGLKTLIATWQQSPTYKPKMIQFLSNAFQQSEVFPNDFTDQGMTFTSNALLLNLQQQMAMTALLNDAAGNPFSANIGGTTFAMTPPLVQYYTYIDNVFIDDNGKTTNGNKGGSFTSALSSYTAADYNNWRLVTVRQPNSGEATSPFNDAPTATTATTLVLKTPRVGFFTTPAFFAGWQTNTSNLARVTTNQMLITSLGHVIDATNPTMPPSIAAEDAAHAAPGTACYSCHTTLDPMKQYYRQAYTLHWSPQNNPNMMSLPGSFGFFGVAGTSTNGIYDLGTKLASHPDMAQAWVQKLCTYANDTPCVTTDPEFVRIQTAFTSGKESWSDLVQEMFSSPIVTMASYTESGAQVQSNPVAKRDHLCPLFDNRLDFNDVCGLSPTTVVPKAMANVALIASILPANAYARGTVTPVLANDPSLFFRAGLENMCALMSTSVVDNGSSPMFASSDPNTAIAKMVHNFMGIQAPEDATPIQALTAHFNSAMAMSGITATSAMQSTFMTACLSPSVVGIGQ